MTLVEALVPAPGERVDLDGADLRAWLAARYDLPGGSWVRVDQITSIGGRTTGPSGTSADLTGGIDRTLLGVLRSAADVVLVGAGSLRQEALGLPRHAALAVATRSGDIAAAHLPEPVDGRRTVVLCPDPVAAQLAAALGERADVVAVADDPVARPAVLLEALAARDCARVVCEGGGLLAGTLLAAGLVDELDHATAPLVASPGALLVDGDVPPQAARLVGLMRDATDRLYARWSLRPA